MRGNITKLKGSVFFLKKMEYDSSLGIKNGWDPKIFRNVLSKLLKLFFCLYFKALAISNILFLNIHLFVFSERER